MIRYLQLSVFIFGCAFIAAQTKHAMTHEDMWLMKRTGAPILTPDGKYAIFSVIDPSYNDKDQVNDLWIAATDRSSPPRKLTATKSGESSYSVSPDGKYLAFAAKRDGEEESQIYLLPLFGGEAQKLTSLPSGAANPKWRADSKALLFTSSIYPKCYTDSLQSAKIKEKKDQKYKVRIYESFPIRNWDRWIDEKQTHLFIQHIDSSKAINIFKDFDLANELGFAFNQAAWAGNDIVLSASTQANAGSYQDPRFAIYKYKPFTQSFESLIDDRSISLTGPRVSPDGMYLYCYVDTIAYKTYSLTKLVKYTYPTLKKVAVVNQKIDRPVNNYEFSGSDLVLSIQDQGRERAVKYAANTITYLDQKVGGGSLTSIYAAGGLIAASYDNLNMPPEVVLLTKDGSLSYITTFNQKKLNTIDAEAPLTFWTSTSRGKQVRSMLVKPAKFDPSKKYPMLVLMHGGPSISYTESFGYRWNPYVIAGEEMVIVMTDYTGSTGYGEKFGQDIQYDPFKGPATEINEAAADAIKRYDFIDGSRQAAGGASYGGHLANWMQATTSHYRCLISHAGLVNSISQWGTSDYIWGREVMNGSVPWGDSKIWKEQNPMTYAEQFKTPMLLTVGELDYRVPVNNTIENWHIHQRLKIPSKLLVFPEENHWILKPDNSKFMYQEVRQWLLKWLNQGKSGN